MGNKKKEQFDDVSGLEAALIAALSVDNPADLVKSAVQILFRGYYDVVENLEPSVRKRVKALQEIQKEHNKLEAKFLEERAALEAKYQKLYAPLYSKIVNGVDDVTVDEKGRVPSFWLNAMKTNEILAEEISERDEDALKYLNDIKWCRIDDDGFKLEFFFDTNPFFTNSVLTKVIYHNTMIDEPAVAISHKATAYGGTKIEWLPGKCLTQKILKNKGSKTITKTEDCDSFFNFFNSLQVPEDEDDIEELQDQMELVYDIGSTIRDKIIQKQPPSECDAAAAS